MATNTAATASPNTTPAPALWQVPIFVLGVSALVGVWFARPLFRGDPGVRIERRLAEVRQILGRPEGDAEYALRLAQQALDDIDLAPHKAGEAAFLAGSAHARLAEKADPLRAEAAWLKAREMLQRAEGAELDEDDARRLTYRLAKAGYHTGEDLARVIGRLERSIDQPDTRAEGYALLTQAYLRQTPPDLARALEANRKLRDVSSAEISDAERTAAQLVGGEILQRMGKPKEARELLAYIQEHSAPAVLRKAHLLTARSHQDERQWGEAVRFYERVLTEKPEKLPELAQVHYDRGVCYRQLGQLHDATVAWLECLKQAQWPEEPAAALALAEMRLAEPPLEKTLEMLTLAVRGVEGPAGWKNPLVDLARARDVFERSIQAMRQGSQDELVAAALKAYAAVAEPRRLTVLTAETKGDWARALTAVKKGDKPSAGRAGRAKELFAESAAAFGQLAALAGLSDAERAGYLWSCAQNARAGGDADKARGCLEAYVKLNLDPAGPAKEWFDRMGEAWYQLGEIYRQAKDKKAAGVAYLKCQEFADVRAACRARYQLAMANLEANEPEEAEAALLLNLKLLRFENDPVALQQTLFELGNLQYRRRHYSRLVRYLEDALGRFKDSPEVFRARYQLADSYRQLALQATQDPYLGEANMSAGAVQHFLSQRNIWERKAADEFAALEEMLDRPEGKEALSPELRVQVPFYAAKCLLNAGQAKKALPIYEKLIERHKGQYEELDALGGAVSCYAKLEQIDSVKQRLLQIEKLLPGLPAEARQPWELWLKDAKKALQTAVLPDDKSAAGDGGPVGAGPALPPETGPGTK